MSHTHPTTSTSSNFRLIFDNALKAYKKRTKNDLLAHPLADRLETCDSASSILIVLQELVQELDESQGGNTKWLDPTVNVLLALSETLGEGVSAVFSPAKVIFVGIGVLLLTAKAVRADQEALSEMFERIEAFFRRLDIYVEIAPTEGMVDTITAIMVEILNFIGIATNQIKEGRTKKYLKKLIGKSDIDDSLKRLDRLTQEEARMASAQLLKLGGIADNVLVVDNRVAGVDDRVAGIDERVAGVDEHVAGVDERVAGVGERVASVDDRLACVDDRVKDVNDRVKAVDDKVAAVNDGVKRAAEVMQQGTDGLADEVDQVKRNQLRQELRGWLSSPDPSTNHNTACNAHHDGTANWFFQGSFYKEWKSTGSSSLLWTHGKPGSGKTVLCSAIIQDIEAMHGAGQASMAYFYFDFRDINKQHWRDLVSSLLIQLSAQSGPCCDILSRLHSTHDSGARQPNDDIMTRCLKEMLMLPEQRPIYLIFDALDECSNTSGIPTPRKRVLQLVKELVDLHIPNLHICVTSRPEVDIRDVLEPLTSRRVSLHDESGQKEDIEKYVRSVVYSTSEPIMRRWRKEDKELVIETLSERADGMFRWIFCQLEVLRDCLPSSVRRTLRELPESLDETYERILKEIKRPNRDLARRVLQCLVVASRPLQVAELAEVLAVDSEDTGGIPRLKPDWRWEEQELALLSACSSLITIVDFKADDSYSDTSYYEMDDDDPPHIEASINDSEIEASDGDLDVEAGRSDLEAETDDASSGVEAGDLRIVQFSHFSVKEFLTSPRLAAASREVSNYYIDLDPAHTILAQACLGVLLQIQDDVEGCTPEDHPLALYAAEHWTTHAQFGEASSRLLKGMEHLFDANKQLFTVWLSLYDIDIFPNDDAINFYMFALEGKFPAAPLYYAALCGFHDLAEHLITKRPRDVNADGGYYARPLVAALAGEHFQTADLLRRNGADLNVQGRNERSPLHAAAFSGKPEVVRKLIEYDPAGIHARDEKEQTPLHWASIGHNFEDGSVLRLLLEHGADINARSDRGRTPLHVATTNRSLEVLRLLLEHGGADVEAKSNKGETALQEAAIRRSDEIVKLLREYGAK